MKSAVFITIATSAAAILHCHDQKHEKRHSSIHRVSEHSKRHSNIYRVCEDDKRAIATSPRTVTVLECILNGRRLTQAECQQGIKNGTLLWSDGKTALSDNGSIDKVKALPAAKPAVQVKCDRYFSKRPASSLAASQQAVTSTSSSSTSIVVNSTTLPSPDHGTSTQAQNIASPDQVSEKWTHNGLMTDTNGINKAFPDNQIPCTEFPSDYGAVPIKWLGLGGWLSAQTPKGFVQKRGGFTDIFTMVRSLCNGANCCSEGAYCSYSCPTGLFKTQWPPQYGNQGQSVGGLLCKNGKLRITNPAHKTLCMPATEKVAVYVENQMSKSVALCQTNYPGDEAMTIPLTIKPHSRVRLPVVDSTTYWRTKDNKPTTLHFYLNPAGISVEQACQWQGQNTGNWSPMIIGSGYNGDMGFFGLNGNLPTQRNEVLKYKVTVTGDVSMPCKYENGQVCSGPGYGKCRSTLLESNGCTIAVKQGGSMTYVLS